VIRFQITIVCDGCGLRAIGEEKATVQEANLSALRSASGWVKDMPFTGSDAGKQLHKCRECQ
jgi:hypothetical protein